MPVNDQTPAPSRRFLPASSSSSKPWTSSSSKRPAFAFSQSKFIPSSATSFTQSSRFETPGRVEKEDIDTSFEDGNSSPSRVPTQVFTPFALSGKDAIYDDDDDDDEDAVDMLEPEDRLRQSLQHQSLHIEDDTAITSHGANYKGNGERHDPMTPLPKRRKVATPAHESLNVIDLSSSPVSDDQAAHHADSEEERGNHQARDEDDDAHGTLSPQLDTPMMPTRFKTAVTQGDFANPARTKAPFRPFVRDKRLGTEAGSVLPDAFSPSRRRGKKEYLSGGLADTIRNWVLNAATEESQRASRSEKVIDLSSAIMDRSGRAIQATDKNEEKWILVGEQDRGDTATSAATLGRVRQRRQVHVRGTATKWRLPLDHQSCENGTFVAAQWDVG